MCRVLTSELSGTNPVKNPGVQNFQENKIVTFANYLKHTVEHGQNSPSSENDAGRSRPSDPLQPTNAVQRNPK